MGMGEVTLLGLNTEETWNNLINGKSGIVRHKFDQYSQINPSSQSFSQTPSSLNDWIKIVLDIFPVDKNWKICIVNHAPQKNKKN